MLTAYQKCINGPARGRAVIVEDVTEELARAFVEEVEKGLFQFERDSGDEKRGTLYFFMDPSQAHERVSRLIATSVYNWVKTASNAISLGKR